MPRIEGAVGMFQIVGNPEIRNPKWSTKDGKPSEGNRVIFPLCESDSSGRLAFVGTGFFICTNGIFVTAKHVVLDRTSTQPIDPLTAIQFIEGHQSIVRPVLRLSTNNTDVAIGVLAPGTHKDTGQPVLNPILPLTTRIPPRASIVTTFAYPKTTVRDTDSLREIYFETSWHSGFALDWFPKGRDKVMLPGPCYRTTMTILGGASGGPVMNTEAEVFGVNSTGIEGLPESYVSAIQSIGGLRIDDVMLPGESSARTVSVNELIDRGFILID